MIRRRLLNAVSSLGRTHSGRCLSTGSDLPTFQKVGFIGLGNMGSQMANNLMKAGHQLVIHDKNEEIVRIYAQQGAISAETPSQVAEETDVIFTMLPSPSVVRDVYLGRNGLLTKQAGVQPALLIDGSTVDLQTTRTIVSFAEQCSLSETSKGIRSWKHPIILDSPVSGGVPAAKAGTLTFMVGGEKDGYNAARPLLNCMGKQVIYCGGSGNGVVAKLCNNLALAVSMAGISEALALGQKLGIDSHTLTNIFNSSSARCWSSDTYNPVPGVREGVPASKEYAGGFSCLLMRKDLGLALAAAEEKGASTPLAERVHEMYSELCAEGKGMKDFSSIFAFTYSGRPEEPQAPTST